MDNLAMLADWWEEFGLWNKPRRKGHALQMKGRWESNKNVWFPFMYSQRWNCYFQNRITYNVLSPSSYTHISVRVYIFPGLVCLFCCREICGPILGVYKSLTLGTEAAQFPEKEYINVIFIAVWRDMIQILLLLLSPPVQILKDENSTSASVSLVRIFPMPKSGCLMEMTYCLWHRDQDEVGGDVNARGVDNESIGGNAGHGGANLSRKHIAVMSSSI